MDSLVVSLSGSVGRLSRFLRLPVPGFSFSFSFSLSFPFSFSLSFSLSECLLSEAFASLDDFSALPFSRGYYITDEMHYLSYLSFV